MALVLPRPVIYLHVHKSELQVPGVSMSCSDYSPGAMPGAAFTPVQPRFCCKAVLNSMSRLGRCASPLYPVMLRDTLS